MSRILILALVVVVTNRPAVAQWSEPSCEALVTVVGPGSGTLFGDRVAATGDVTGDGVPDFAVSAPFFQTNRGRVSVHSGADGSEVWSRTTSTQSMILGFSLAVCDDVNGDDVRDVLAGAPFAPNTGGFVFVYSGSDGSTIHTFQGDPTGFNASIGYSVVADGDFDGDGVDDIAIADGGHDGVGPNSGRVSVYSSVDFSLICNIDPPVTPVARFGTGLSYIGDVTGDGRDDLVIAGRIVSSETPGRLHVFAYDGETPVLLHSIAPVNLGCQLCGDSVGGGLDMDGDGLGDIIIGEPSTDFRARVFSGVSGALILQAEAAVQDAILIDDIDGDGLADIAGGNSANDEGGDNAGKVYLIAGATGEVLRTMTATAPGWGFGTRLGRFDDLDGDGVFDLLVGARSGVGRVFVMAGGTGVCVGDTDVDGDVDADDLVSVILDWGTDGAAHGGDVDVSGTVDANDLVQVILDWGPC